MGFTDFSSRRTITPAVAYRLSHMIGQRMINARFCAGINTPQHTASFTLKNTYDMSVAHVLSYLASCLKRGTWKNTFNVSVAYFLSCVALVHERASRCTQQAGYTGILCVSLHKHPICLAHMTFMACILRKSIQMCIADQIIDLSVARVLSCVANSFSSWMLVSWIVSLWRCEEPVSLFPVNPAMNFSTCEPEELGFECELET